jgi:hypothetical protein
MDKYTEPFRMDDGRSFTDYRPNHELDKEVKKYLCKANNKCCTDNYNYKVCLVNSCDNIKAYLSNDPFKSNFM